MGALIILLILHTALNMKTKPYLTLEDTHKILAAAEGEAKKNNWAVCIAVVDDGGHLLGFLRLDACAASSIAFAQGKAYSAALRRRPTKSDEDMVNNGRFSALSMQGITFLEGGLPIVVNGEIIGAVGVSGVKSSDDALIAQAGIDAVTG